MKHFIFDLDGTLLNTLPTISHYGNLALSKNGLSTYPEDNYRKFVGDGKDELIERMLKGQNANTPDMFLKVSKVYDTAYENDTLYLTEPYKNINLMLSSLKEKGAKLFVLSNKPGKFLPGSKCLHFDFNIIFFFIFHNYTVIHINTFRKSNHYMHYVVMYGKSS